METDRSDLAVNSKDSEIVLIVSLTVNFCVLWSFALPRLSRAVLFGGSQTKGQDESEDKTNDLPIFCRRFSTNLIFYLAMPVCGVILLASTDVLQDPFFLFNRTFRMVFSMALGHYVFKTAEVVLFRHEVFHYKPLLVHHLVAIAMYSTILKYQQNTILGLVGLFLEGSLAFAELEQERLSHALSLQENTTLRKIGTSVALVLAIVLRGVVPVSLISMAFVTSSKDLLRMSYVPLAFFFLSLVFFAAVDVWFFKDAYTEVSRQFTRRSLLPTIHLKIPTAPLTTTAVNHDGLTKLLQTNGGLNGSINITHNALWGKDLNLNEESPALLHCEPLTPPEIKAGETLNQKHVTLWM